MLPLRRNLSALRKDLAALTQALTDDARSRVNSAAQAATEGIRAARKDIEDKGRESVAAVSHQVQENPITSILTAAGVGFVLGALLRRS